MHGWKRLSKLDKPTSTTRQIVGIYLNFKCKLFNETNKWNYKNILSVNFKLVFLLLLLLNTFKLCTFFWREALTFKFFSYYFGSATSYTRRASIYKRPDTRDTRLFDYLRRTQRLSLRLNYFTTFKLIFNSLSLWRDMNI